MKRISTIVVLAFLGVGLALWVAQNYSGQWEPRVRQELETRGGKALSARLRIGEITISFLLRATAKDIELWDTQQNPEVLLFRANQVRLTPSLLDLPRALLRRNVLDAIGRIEVDTPVLTLDPGWLSRIKQGKKSTGQSPLWFGVEWKNGTLQWKDPKAPRGRWTLYQARGHFRIRGPRTDVMARGLMDHTESVSAHVSTLLGKRWSAQMRVVKGSIPGLLETVQDVVQKQILPEGWLVRGRFNLNAELSGRLPWNPQVPLGGIIREVQLNLSDAYLQTRSTAPALQFLGGLDYQDNAIDVSDLSVKAESTIFKLSGKVYPFTKPARADFEVSSAKALLEDLARYTLSPSSRPWASGAGRLTVFVKGAFPQPSIQVDADYPQGMIGPWPFQAGRFLARRAAERWEIDPSQIKLWNGVLGIKGTYTPANRDIQVTGSDLRLDSIIPSLGKDLAGRLSFSMAMQGPSQAPVTTGSYGVNGFTWVQTSTESLRGDFEVTRNQFRLQGGNDNPEIKLQVSGSHSPKSIVLDQAHIQLRQGMSLQLRGSFLTATRLLKASLSAKNISLPQDIPMLHTRAPTLKGHADLQGTWEGSLTSPSIRLDAVSEDFSMGTSSTTRATASLRWSLTEYTLLWAHAGSGLNGTWRAAREQTKKWTLYAALNTPEAKTTLKGQAFTELSDKEGRTQKLRYQGEGTVQASNESSWRIPWTFKGEWMPQPENKGQITLETPAVEIYGQKTEAAQARIQWTSKDVRWDNFRWGRNLIAAGSLNLDAQPATLAAELKVQDLHLAIWQKIFYPQMKEPVQGILNGAFSLSGSLADPHLQFSGQVAKAHWRAFRFDSRIEGTWKNAGFEPITIDGNFTSGGRYKFQGRISTADRTAAGNLELAQVELRPLGESLSFPHPFEGKANGTFSVNGPLDQLRLVGHLEGSNLSYGNKNAAPLKLTSYVTDLTVEPRADQPGITRLTLSKVLAKTLEEEIRLTPGSFVEFSGAKEARMQLGAEIRNVHLGVFTLFGGLDINGTWKIQPEGFALQGDILTRSLYINDYQLEQGHVQASYYNRVLSFTPPNRGPSLVIGTIDFRNAPQLDFKDFSLTGQDRERLQLSGTIGPEKWNFNMEGRGLDIGTLGGLAGFPYKLSGSAYVKIRGMGNLQNPDVQGNLEVHDGRALGLDFRSGSAKFAWQGSRMTFTRLQLSDPGRYTLEGAGIFPLATKANKTTHDKTINFSIRLIDSNLGLLQSVTPQVKTARGSLQGLMQITGTTDAPMMQGSLRVRNGDIVGAHYFRHVENFQLDATIAKDTLSINEFRGQSGKGEFKGGGKVTFAGFVPLSYDLHLDIPSSKGVEVTIPELAIPESPLAKRFKFLTQASQGIVKGRATFKGSAEAPVFFADALITNGHFTFPPSSKNPPPSGFTQWIRRITWDTHLQFKDDAWFENELVEANLLGELSIKGPSQKLRVDGGMDITKGQISYLGVQFDIQQARFEIHSNDTGSTIVNTPYLRGLADSHVQTVDPLTGQSVDDTISLLINYAPINEIKPILRSTLDPTLSQEKLFARVTQLEVENLTPQERTYLYQQQMVRLLDTSLATPLARNLLKRTGLVDQVRVSRVINPTAGNPLVDPTNPLANQQQSDTATNLLAGTKYTVAKNLSNRLSLGYGVRFEQGLNPDLTNKLDLRSDVEMSYRFLSNVYLRGTFDLPSQNTGLLPERKVTIEPHWRFGWWGNTNKDKRAPTPRSQPPAATTPTPK